MKTHDRPDGTRMPAAIPERLGLSLERAMMVWFGTALLLVLLGLG
ncbi:MAG: hypothetical protein ACK5TQ_13770 [Acetobacteraceae bacterium]|jgi:hypothetical protein